MKRTSNFDRWSTTRQPFLVESLPAGLNLSYVAGDDHHLDGQFWTCSKGFITFATDDITNETSFNFSKVTYDPEAPYGLAAVIVIVIVCGLIIVGTIIGNILVCTAVVIVRKLRTPSNLLIVSLAVSDLLVAMLDMPFATVYEVGVFNNVPLIYLVRLRRDIRWVCRRLR